MGLLSADTLANLAHEASVEDHPQDVQPIVHQQNQSFEPVDLVVCCYEPDEKYHRAKIEADVSPKGLPVQLHGLADDDGSCTNDDEDVEHCRPNDSAKADV